jgi:hypothetical protein
MCSLLDLSNYVEGSIDIMLGDVYSDGIEISLCAPGEPKLHVCSANRAAQLFECGANGSKRFACIHHIPLVSIVDALINGMQVTLVIQQLADRLAEVHIDGLSCSFGLPLQCGVHIIVKVHDNTNHT